MAKNVITLDCNKTVLDASNKYKDHKVGCLVITDEGKCVGIVTERDIIERTICAHKSPENTKISEIMTSDIKTIHALDPIEKAIQIMEDYKIKKLPVVQKEQIVGIITVTDISRARPDLSKRFIESWVKPRWE
jgi:CBS domain-containing protein